MKLSNLSYFLVAAGLVAVNTGAQAQSQWSMTGSGNSSAVGTAAGDAAYARQMRAEYAKDALQNSTTAAEAAMSQAALQTADCNKIVVAADTAKKAYVYRHTAPDPTQVIKNSTCFIDVFNIKIPLKTGFGLVDGLISQLSKMATDSMCNSTNTYWSKISNAASSGDLSSLASSAIASGAQYIPQNIYTQVTAPMQSGGNSSGGNGSGSGAQPGFVAQPGGGAQPGVVAQPGVGTLPGYVDQPGGRTTPGGGGGTTIRPASAEPVPRGGSSVLNAISDWLK